MAGERDLLSIDDLTSDELWSLLRWAEEAKADPGSFEGRLRGKHVALLFEKPSTRTRVSFEVAVTSMGGSAVVLKGEELQLDRGETIEDTGRVLSRYVDAIVLRTFGQDRLERLADAATVPVVNALSDFSHPCQCLGDMLTIREKRGDLRDVRLVYVGDANNVAHSLMFGGTKLGMDVCIACPPDYEPFPQVVERSREIAAETGGSIEITHNVREAVVAADVIYTDVWTSMGQEAEREQRRVALADYQVNTGLVSRAREDVIVMHCLPAHRGEEISPDVMDGPRSVVWDQAENRLHAQKALLAWLLA